MSTNLAVVVLAGGVYSCAMALVL